MGQCYFLLQELVEGKEKSPPHFLPMGSPQEMPKRGGGVEPGLKSTTALRSELEIARALGSELEVARMLLPGVCHAGSAAGADPRKVDACRQRKRAAGLTLRGTR